MISKREIKDWILISLLPLSKRTGINVPNLYFKRPEDMEFSYQKFYDIIRELENQKLITKASIIGGHHCITENGTKEIKERLNWLKKEEIRKYQRTIQFSPMVEIKERISNIEEFISNSVLAMSSFIIYAHILTDDSYIDLFFTFLTVLFSIYAMKNFSFIVSFAFERFRENFAIKFWNYIDKQERNLFHIIFLIAVIGISYFLNYMGIEWNWIIGTIALTLIGNAIWNRKALFNKFMKFKEKYKRKAAL